MPHPAPHRVACLLLGLLACAGPAAAAPPDDDRWTDHVVEVEAVSRHAPSEALRAKRAEIEAALRAAADGAARVRAERRLDDVNEEIKRTAPVVVSGWSARFDRRRDVLDGTRSLVAFIVPATARNRRVLADLGRGSFVRLPLASMRDLFTTGGRRYREAMRIEAIPRPARWRARARTGTPLAPDPTTTDQATVTIRFQREQARETGHLYRYQLGIDARPRTSSPPSARLALRVRVRAVDGQTYGPFPVDVTVKRTKTGAYAQHRSWEIITLGGLRLDAAAATVEVVAVRAE